MHAAGLLPRPSQTPRKGTTALVKSTPTTAPILFLPVARSISVGRQLDLPESVYQLRVGHLCELLRLTGGGKWPRVPFSEPRPT